MNKIKFLKESYSDLDPMVKAHLIFNNDGTPNEFIRELNKKFPKLPRTYLDFLELYGAPSIEWISFRGAPTRDDISIPYLLEMWKDDYGIDLVDKGYCPIGEDAAGDLFCLSESQKIVMFDCIIYEQQEPKIIAESFDEFMDECVLGKRYSEMSIENSNFHNFLKSQGWA